jgi:hypothetical protein
MPSVGRRCEPLLGSSLNQQLVAALHGGGGMSKTYYMVAWLLVKAWQTDS